jgi:sulfite reductase alpha subunit-like flavoprotein
MIRILYGSQSGSAEDVARRIGRDAYLKGYDTALSSMNDYEKVMQCRLMSSNSLE